MFTAEPLDAIMREAVEAGDVAGVVAFAATKDGTLDSGAWGLRRFGEPAPMTADSIFWLASLTKAITTIAALQLVERGLLQLDAPIGAVMPELAAPLVLTGFDASGLPTTRPAAGPITLRALLTHTSGFGYDMWSSDLVRYQSYVTQPGTILSRNDTLSNPLLFDPGQRFAYGVGLDWTGKIVERISGRTLHEYIREAICEPLGMADTTFIPDASQRARLAGMHARKPDGTLRAVRFEVPERPAFCLGGGGMYGTAPDYVRLLRAIMREGELDGARVLRPESVALMLQNQIGDITLDAMRSAMPAITNDVDFFRAGDKWGFGFLLSTEPVDGGRNAGSVSWAGLANAYYWLDPRAQICGIILTHQRPFADPAVLRLYGRFERGVYAAYNGLAQRN